MGTSFTLGKNLKLRFTKKSDLLRSAQTNPDLVLLKVKGFNINEFQEEDCIKVETVNITKHLTNKSKKKLGLLDYIQIDKNERYLISIW